MSLTFFTQLYSKSPVTGILMILVLVFSLTGLLNKKLFLEFILHPVSVIRDKQYYRVFTADLVNADILHLILNEFMLYVFCSDLEETLRKRTGSGSLHFIVIYLSSLVIGSVIVVARHHRDFNYSTTGTSGSIMGCMFGFMLLAPGYVVYYLPGIGEIKNIYGGLCYILILIVYQRRNKQELINHEIHFFGAVGGILATLALHPELLQGIRG